MKRYLLLAARVAFGTLAAVSVLVCFGGLIAAMLIDFYDPMNRIVMHASGYGLCSFIVFALGFAFVEEGLLED